jgi:multidrug transporter EmrE-like cation transporter
MILLLVLFVIMQVIATLFFKWGSDNPSRWIYGYILGNLIAVSSVYLLMSAYKHMNPNVALGVFMGAAFLASQIALALFYKSGLSPLQWGGTALITTGIFMLSFFKPSVT